jgi:hypothetical protein
MIIQRPEEGSRTPERPCCYLAEPTVDGVTFSALERLERRDEILRSVAA